MKFKTFLFSIGLSLLLSGCSWSNYEGCALWPTDTEPRYEYTNPENFSGKYNSTQSWWEYKSGEFGFFWYGNEKGNAPWWAYPKDIVALPIEYTTLFILVLSGAEMP